MGVVERVSQGVLVFLGVGNQDRQFGLLNVQNTLLLDAFIEFLLQVSLTALKTNNQERVVASRVLNIGVLLLAILETHLEVSILLIQRQDLRLERSVLLLQAALVRLEGLELLTQK